MENTAEFFYEKLKSPANTGAVLAAHLSSLYETEITKSAIIMCNKLVRIFGKFTVFFAIIDMAGSYPQPVENPYPLLYSICKRRFEQSHVGSLIQSHESLDKFILGLDKEIAQRKKTKVKAPSPEGLDE